MLNKYKFEFTSFFIDNMYNIEKWKLARKSCTYQKLDKVYVFVSNAEISMKEDKLKNEIILQIVKNSEQVTLSDYSQEFSKEAENYILKKKVSFQGKLTDIQSLCGDSWKMVFDENSVCDILENKVLEISTLLPTLEYYVPRTFTKEILDLGYYEERIKTWNLTSNGIILFSEENKCILGHNAAYQFFLNMKEVRTFIQKLVLKDKGIGCYHLCSHKNDQLQWFHSFGNKSGYTRECIIGEDDLTNETNAKISIISDVAGMGKTTTLLSLARKYKEKNPSHWVSFIELNIYLDSFKNINELSSTDSVVHFIGTFLLHLEATELLLFTNACKSGNSALFFDAFDEISPDAEETFSLLLLALEKTRIKNIVVSSRPNFASRLEEKLLLTPINFLGLTTEEKELALEGYWKQMLGKEGKIIQDNLLKKTAKSTVALLQLERAFLSEILAIPLQIRVVAIVYYELLSNINSEEHFPNLSSINLAALYEQFIILHAERFYVDKHKMRWNNVQIDQKQRFIQDKLKGAEEIACQIIIPEVLKNDLIDRRKEISALCDDVGIITYKSPVVFLHRTVAEYLAAKYIVREIFCKCNNNDTQIVTNILVDEQFNIVRKFINSLLILNTADIFGNYRKKEIEIIREISEETPIYISASEGNIEIVRHIAKNNTFLNMRNSYGKTALLCACEYSKNEAVKLLLSYKDCSVNISDNAGYTVLHAASRRGDIEIIQLILHRDSNLINRQNRNGFTALHTACYLRNREVAKMLLSNKDCSVNICDNGGNTVLHVASWRVDIEIIQLILQRDSTALNMQDNIGFTPLLEACRNSQTEVAKLLLSHKDCSVNICDNDGDTVLHAASMNGDIEILQIILEKDRSSLNMRNNRGLTPLHVACYHRKSEALKLLFSYKDCTVDICDNDGDTVIHHTSMRGDVEIMHLLLQYDSSLLNMQDNMGFTPLHKACRSGQKKAAKLLLSHKDCSVNICDNGGDTVLHVTSMSGDIELMQLILKKDRSSLYMQNRSGITPLHAACYLRKRKAAKLLLSDKNCLLNICDNGGNTVLHVASWIVDIEIMQLILQRDISLLNMQDNVGFTPLHETCRNGQTEVAKLLLSHKDCSVNICDNTGATVLHAASWNGYIGIMQLILERDSSLLNMQNKRGFTPLHEAYINNKTEAVKLLLYHKDCTVEICDNDGDNVLHIASWSGYIEIMHLILQRNSSLLNMQNKRGFTPLHEACKCDATETMKLFLSHKDCKVNICDNVGATVLHVASMNGNVEIMQLILQYNSSVINMKNKRGFTPLHEACYYGKNEAVKYLLEQSDCKFNKHDFSPPRGLTALDVARMEGYTDIIELLLKNGAMENQSQCTIL